MTEASRVENAMDRAYGLRTDKYFVMRVGGTPHKHDSCDFFVLDWNHDPYAVPAALAYADACEEECPGLAHDLRVRVIVASKAQEKSPTPKPDAPEPQVLTRSWPAEEGPGNVESLPRSLVVDVGHCARCGADHPGLTFARLTRATKDGFQYWVLCPHLSEPILLRRSLPSDPGQEAT